MNYMETELRGVWLLEPEVWQDSRGYFFEAFKEEELIRRTGCNRFIQDNESCSTRGVLRGLHYQAEPLAQAKLVRVPTGCILDVAVDLRKDSPTYLQYIAVELSDDNKRQLFIPRGFAHGFRVLSDRAVVIYKIDYPYSPTHERSIRYNDPRLAIDWRLNSGETPLLSDKDRNAPLLTMD